jgi:hypothetical protein
MPGWSDGDKTAVHMSSSYYKQLLPTLQKILASCCLSIERISCTYKSQRSQLSLNIEISQLSVVDHPQEVSKKEICDGMLQK